MTEKARIQLVYGGVDDGFQDKKLHHVYYQILDDGTLDSGKPLYFGKMLADRQGKPGAILDCLKWWDDEGDCFRYSEIKINGRWPFRDWVIAQQARDVAVREARSEIRERYKDQVRNCLEPLKAVYKLLSPQQKRAMLAMIMEYLSRRG